MSRLNEKETVETKDEIMDGAGLVTVAAPMLSTRDKGSHESGHERPRTAICLSSSRDMINRNSTVNIRGAKVM